MRLSVLLGVGVVLLLLLQVAHGYPNGAPDRPSICRTLKPGHVRTKAQAIPPLFSIEVNREEYNPGETLQGNNKKNNNNLYLIRVFRLVSN